MSVRSIFWPSPFTVEMTGYVDRRVPSLVIPCLWLLTCKSGISKSETEGFSNVNRNPFLCNLIAFERKLTNCAPKWSCNVMAAKRRTCGCQSTVWTLSFRPDASGFPIQQDCSAQRSLLHGLLQRHQLLPLLVGFPDFKIWVGSNLATFFPTTIFIHFQFFDSLPWVFMTIFWSFSPPCEGDWPLLRSIAVPKEPDFARSSRGWGGAELQYHPNHPNHPNPTVFFFGRWISAKKKCWTSIDSWKDGRLNWCPWDWTFPWSLGWWLLGHEAAQISGRGSESRPRRELKFGVSKLLVS